MQRMITHEENRQFKELFGMSYYQFNDRSGSLDVVKLDEHLALLDEKYLPDKCMYNGQNVSMAQYVKLKYGKEALKLVEKLIISKKVKS